jgi:hypothetical protein
LTTIRASRNRDEQFFDISTIDRSRFRRRGDGGGDGGNGLNTADTIERKTDKRPDIIPAATPVQIGVGQILALTENGYTLVRP